MAYTVPSVSDFKAYFVRDFPYGMDMESVMDTDITKAISEAGFNINQGLFGTQEQFTIGYLYLTAHYLVIDLRAGSQGVNGKYSWLTTSRSVGSVSEGMQVPQRILDNPYLAMLSTTNYGAKYLSLLLPQLTGQIFTSEGTTLP